MELTEQQLRVFNQIKAFMDSDASVFILRGYAGTGKTTMIKFIADYLAPRCNVKLMAPTGRAARVLTVRTGHPSCTIHKAIYERACLVSTDTPDVAESEYKFVFPIHEDDKEGKVVAIVDEASMVCSRKMEHELFVFGTDNLLEDLLTYVRPSFGGKIIFVGDPAQLPPVGASGSNALNAEYFKERGFKVFDEELTEVLRQTDGSVILKNAMMIRDLLNSEKRNCLVFEEKENDVETIPPKDFLNKYIEYRKQSTINDCVVICYSNKTASAYNRKIRTALYGKDVPIRENDILLIAQNNYRLGRMNGEFVPVLDVGARTQQSAPVYIQVGGEKKRIVVTINFVQVTVLDGNGNPMTCMLVEDFLTSEKAAMSVDENRALYINFCIRNPYLKQGTPDFCDALMSDPYYNAIRAKYGYAVTGHKCQGGEWDKVFVDYTGRTGLNDDSLRWAYTVTTRAKHTLYVTNLPHVMPFDKFRIDNISKCKTINAEFRVTAETEPTPFHTALSENYLKAKYHCIADNMYGTPFSIVGVISKPYMEVYQIQTPKGVDRYDIHYKAGGVFLPAKLTIQNEFTQQVLMLLNDERMFPFIFNYTPSDETHRKLYDMIRSACDSLSIQMTNVVEHPEDFSVMYYMRTSGTCSYIKVYIDRKGFVSYAKPMSMLGVEDGELNALIKEINNRMK